MIRKIHTVREEILLEGGRAPERRIERAIAAAVVSNPWAGTWTEDLAEGVAAIAPRLAAELSDRLLDALGGADAIEAFGKGALVGLAGEAEHGAALIHTPLLGDHVREVLDGTSIIAFSELRAAAGTPLLVPMWHKTEAATRSHYQAIDVRIADAPRDDEILIALAASTGPRPFHRIGDRRTDHLAQPAGAAP